VFSIQHRELSWIFLILPPVKLLKLLKCGLPWREWKEQGRLEENTSVLVEGGRTVPYETIITVLDEVRRGGVDAVNLITAPISEEE